MTLHDYVLVHVERGGCKCGRCDDPTPDPQALQGCLIDMVFFTCAVVGEPTAEEFIRLTTGYRGAYGDGCSPLDGKEHNYMELGAWIGDQGMAMMYMALGTHLGVFDLLTGYTILKLPKGDPMALEMAQMGLLAVTRKETPVAV